MLYPYCSNNTINANNASGTGSGINLCSSSNNTVNGNSATANIDGILLWGSSNYNTVSGNNATANYYGIEIDSSSGNVLSNNALEDNSYNFDVSGSALGDFMNSVDTSNLVNGKPVYYIMSKSNLVINPENYPNIGYLAVVNCTNMTVQGLTFTLNWQGILFAFTNDSKITNNNATNNGSGIDLESSSNNTVSGNNATANYWGICLLYSSNNNTVIGNNATANGNYGIDLYSSSNNTVSGNNATANAYGIYLYGSSDYNAISGNNVTANGVGIVLQSSSNNTIYNNNFVKNAFQVSSDGSSNMWDKGYPSGGNYWSYYNGTDMKTGVYQNVTGSDGIGDTPYFIDQSNEDNYPFMGMFSGFTVAQGVEIQVVSNSTISDFQFNGTAIQFNVSGANGSKGFCNVRIPTALLNGTLRVFVNGTQVQYSLLPSSNSISYLYFTYGRSTEQVVIVPEFPASLILAMLMLATLLAIAIYKKKHNRF